MSPGGHCRYESQVGGVSAVCRPTCRPLSGASNIIQGLAPRYSWTNKTYEVMHTQPGCVSVFFMSVIGGPG